MIDAGCIQPMSSPMMNRMLGFLAGAGVWALAWGAVSKPTAKSVVAEVSSVLSFISVLRARNGKLLARRGILALCR